MKIFSFQPLKFQKVFQFTYLFFVAKKYNRVINKRLSSIKELGQKSVGKNQMEIQV